MEDSPAHFVARIATFLPSFAALTKTTLRASLHSVKAGSENVHGAKCSAHGRACSPGYRGSLTLSEPVRDAADWSSGDSN